MLASNDNRATGSTRKIASSMAGAVVSLNLASFAAANDPMPVTPPTGATVTAREGVEQMRESLPSVSAQEENRARDGKPAVDDAKESRFEEYFKKFGPALLAITGTLLVVEYIGRRLTKLARQRDSGEADVSLTNTFATPPEERLDNVGGCPHVVEELRELVQDLRRVRLGELDAREVAKGILLAGGPGAGKTLIARALAGELNVPFLYVNSASIVASKWAGDWSKAVLDCFADAREARDNDTEALREAQDATGDEQGVAVLFFDEFDSVGGQRNDSGEGASREYNDVVNALLAEMDSVEEGRNKGIIVLGATNHPGSIDQALLRPGRLTRTINVPTPQTDKQRLDILEKLNDKLITPRGYTWESENPFANLSKITVGDTGDYLRGILVEAVSLARRAGTTVITEAHIVEAYQRQHFGRAHEDLLSPARQELVAHHEHGHALTALAFGINPFVVSMVARGETGGRVLLDPNATYQPPASLRDILRTMVLNLGGRAAELVQYGGNGITEGAAQDLDTCRKLLRRALTFGMINDLYSFDVLDHSMDMPNHYHEMVDQKINEGLGIAKKIIEAAGTEVMKRLVADSLAMKRELIGAEASRFYQDRIPAATIEKMRQIAAEFVGNEGKSDSYGPA